MYIPYITLMCSVKFQGFSMRPMLPFGSSKIELRSSILCFQSKKLAKQQHDLTRWGCIRPAESRPMAVSVSLREATSKPECVQSVGCMR